MEGAALFPIQELLPTRNIESVIKPSWATLLSPRQFRKTTILMDQFPEIFTF